MDMGGGRSGSRGRGRPGRSTGWSSRLVAFVAAALVLSLAALVVDEPEPAFAATTLPVTVVVKSLQALDNALESDADLYAVVHVGQTGELDKYGKFDTFAGHEDDEDFTEPNAHFKVNVPHDLESLAVVFEGWDHDNCSSAGPCDDLFDPDDRGDVAPEPEFNAASVRFDITLGFTAACTEGDQAGKIRLCYEIWSFEPGLDDDRDGLLNRWETNGLDMDGDGVTDLDLPRMGARWDHADIFLELDYEAGQAPSRESIQAMKKAFAAAPVFNPDGRAGIRLWVDTGGLIDPTARQGQPVGSCLDGVDNGGDGLADADDPDCNGLSPRRYLETSSEDLPGNCMGSVDPTCLVGDNLGEGKLLTTPVGACGLDAAFYAAKRVNFDPVRRWVFRYAISAAQPASCSKQTGGQGEIGGNDFIDFNHDGGTIMHELGHNLNLDHGGDTGANCKPNYVSVMNYDHQLGIRRDGGGAILDYSMPRRTLSGFDLFGGLPPGVISRGPVPKDLFETDLDDGTVIDAQDAFNRSVFVNGKGNKDNERLDRPIDWNDDGDTADLNQMLNVDTGTPNPVDCQNTAVSASPMRGFNDWLKVSLSMNLRQFGDSRDGALNPSPDISPTRGQLVELERQILRADIATSISGTPDPVAAGTDVTYQVRVRNNGPDPAPAVVAKVTLAEGLQLQSAPGCAQAGEVVNCTVGGLGVGKERLITVVAGVPADLVYLNGSPKVLRTTARADDALADPLPANNEAASSVTAVAVADLSATGATASGAPVELLVGEPAAVGVQFTVANGGPSSPMDATVTINGTASAGATISPASQTAGVTALRAGFPQKVGGNLVLRCAQPGIQTFVLNGTVAPTRPDDSDPLPSNNQSTVTITVECVVPIAINIRPGDRDNVYRIGGGDALPVALLSTHAGEYGLPLDFDATAAEVSSLRFGQRELVFANLAGSTEHQGKAQVLDTFEPDDRTKDGDDDLRAQFSKEGTGLGSNDTEACVKGVFEAPGGARFKFFGCDTLRLVP